MSFELVATQRLDALDIEVQEYHHRATGLVHYHLASRHDENAFMIGFRTQPMTSRGEAHILEHVVLCGSQNYPVRDPFFSMIKRSVNTFMNAMTAADWTVYPFASQNQKDYFNLLSVYIDAVFFPNIHALDFAQEGVRVELDDDGKPHYHGVVYNEMKGANSESERLYRALSSALFTQTTYHHHSGGDPEFISDLTHQDLLDFHAHHYHPTNAVAMSFGNIDAAKIHTRLEMALARFDDNARPKRGKIFTSIAEPDSTPVRTSATYNVERLDKAQTQHVLAWRLPTMIDSRLRLAMRVVEGILCEHAGSPLRAYLDTHPLGVAASPFLGLDDSHYHMVFYAGLRGSEPCHADAVEQGIIDTIKQVIATPIDQDEIEMVLHQIELDKRHIGGDGMPYGLTLLLEGFSTAIHGGNPIDAWHIDDTLDWLKNALKDDAFLPNLMQKYLIDNPNRAFVSLLPDENYTQKFAQQEARKLANLAQTLDDTARANLRKNAQDLQTRQDQVDDLSVLPSVSIDELGTPNQWALGQETVDAPKLHEKGAPVAGAVYAYEAGTNGLYYYQVVIDATPFLDNPLLPLYVALVGELGTHDTDARAFVAQQACVSSGVTARISMRTNLDDSGATAYLAFATRALVSKPEAMAMVARVLDESAFADRVRLKEILSSRQMNQKSRIGGAGHAYALQMASSGTSLQSRVEYAYSGLPALVALNEFLQNDDENWQILQDALTDLHSLVQSAPRSGLVVAEAPDTFKIAPYLVPKACVHSATPLPDAFAKLRHIFDAPMDSVGNVQTKDSAYLIASQVYHHAQSFPVVGANHADTAPLMVLALFLQNGYLHKHIREQGGAYGGGASFDANARAFRFYSYRDPSIDTPQVFASAVQWFLDGTHEKSVLDEAILGIVGHMDKPASPAGEAVKACFARWHGRDEAWQATLRTRLLAVTLDDLQRVARTYLYNMPSVRAVIAPMDAYDKLTEKGYACHTL